MKNIPIYISFFILAAGSANEKDANKIEVTFRNEKANSETKIVDLK